MNANDPYGLVNQAQEIIVIPQEGDMCTVSDFHSILGFIMYATILNMMQDLFCEPI